MASELPFRGGEDPLDKSRCTFDGSVEALQLHHVDAYPDDGHGYSTVTDLAKLRGWSTSKPFALASS